MRHYTVSGAGSWRGVVNGWDVANAVGSNTGGENPQPAAHFVIEQDGTIYQTMPTNLMVRHAYGLNYAAIGIEFIEWSQRSGAPRPSRGRVGTGALADVRAWNTGSEHPGPRNGQLQSLFVDLTGARNDHPDWNAAEVNAFRSRLGAVPVKPRALIGAIAQRYL